MIFAQFVLNVHLQIEKIKNVIFVEDKQYMRKMKLKQLQKGAIEEKSTTEKKSVIEEKGADEKGATDEKLADRRQHGAVGTSQGNNSRRYGRYGNLYWMGTGHKQWLCAAEKPQA